jgi:hypothetical protein
MEHDILAQDQCCGSTRILSKATSNSKNDILKGLEPKGMLQEAVRFGDRRAALEVKEAER